MRIGTHKIFKREELPDELLDRMMLFNPEYQKAEMLGLSTRHIPKYIALFKEKDGLVYIPRNYKFPPEFESYDIPPDIDERVDGADVHYTSRIIPRDEQEEAIAKLVETENGILEAGCGKGKTVMALEAIARVGKPALVLVHKEFLLDQWRDRAWEFLGEEVGIIQGSKCDYKGRKIVIGMLQSLANPDKYPKEMFSYFGIIVSDECHRVASRTWSEVIQLFPARRRWGLTATLKRTDGMEVVFKAHLGDVIHTIKGEDLSPVVYAVKTHTFFGVGDLVNRWTGQIQVPKLLTKLSKIEERNDLIHGMLRDALMAGRQVLVLSDRVDHLKGIAKWAKEEIPQFKTMLYIGATKQEERDKAGDYDLILGTMSLAKEGLDIPSLDTLFLVTPTGSPVTVQQAVGRIVREYDGKRQPLVVDFVDELIGICNSLYHKRKAVYRKLGYEIKEIG